MRVDDVTARAPTPDALREALARHPRLDIPALPGRTSHLPSAVLVPLSWEPQLVCIVTVRAGGLRRHAGGVCFPGGRPDPADCDLEHTALREAREELGIEGARVLGELSSIPLLTSDYRMRPFVAEVPPQSLRVNADEVAEVLRIPLVRVLVQPQVDAIDWQHAGERGLAPVFELAPGRVMYGATAYSFYELLNVVAPLCGVEVPPLRTGRFDWNDVRVDGRGEV